MAATHRSRGESGNSCTSLAHLHKLIRAFHVSDSGAQLKFPFHSQQVNPPVSEFKIGAFDNYDKRLGMEHGRNAKLFAKVGERGGAQSPVVAFSPAKNRGILTFRKFKPITLMQEAGPAEVSHLFYE